MALPVRELERTLQHRPELHVVKQDIPDYFRSFLLDKPVRIESTYGNDVLERVTYANGVGKADRPILLLEGITTNGAAFTGLVRAPPEPARYEPQRARPSFVFLLGEHAGYAVGYGNEELFGRIGPYEPRTPKGTLFDPVLELGAGQIRFSPF